MNILRGEIEATLGGKPRLIKFGLNQMAIYTDKHNVALSDIQGFSVSQVRDLVWSGLVAGARKKGEQIDFDEWQVGDWIEEMPQEEFDKIMEAFQNSMPTNAEEAKKK